MTVSDLLAQQQARAYRLERDQMAAQLARLESMLQRLDSAANGPLWGRDHVPAQPQPSPVIRRRTAGT